MDANTDISEFFGLVAKTRVYTLSCLQNQLSSFSCENTLRAVRPNTQVLKLSPSRCLWPCSQNFKRVISKSLRWEHITPIFGTQSISGNWFSSRGRFLIGKPGQGVIRSQRFVIITQWLLCNCQIKRFIGNRHMVWNWWWGWWMDGQTEVDEVWFITYWQQGEAAQSRPQPNKAIASLPRTTPALAQIYCARSDDLWLLRLKIS